MIFFLKKRGSRALIDAMITKIHPKVRPRMIGQARAISVASHAYSRYKEHVNG